MIVGTRPSLAAAELLGTRLDRAAEQALQQMLRHSDPRSRVAAAQALDHVGSPQSNQALIDALQDVDDYVRGTAAAALARVGVGSDAARTALLSLLDDSSDAVVGLAARSLGVLGGDGVADRLKNLALDHQKSLWNRTVAAQAAALLYRRPQSWMRSLADQYRGAGSTTGQAKFRGPLIDAVTRGAWDDDVASWTRQILLADPDPINQTVAATALGDYGQLSPRLARDFLEGGGRIPGPRSHSRGGRPGGAPAGAVLQGAIKSAASNSEDLATVVGMLADTLNASTSPDLANSTLSALRSLEPDEAVAFLPDLRARLTGDSQQRLDAILKRHESEEQHRLDEVHDYNRLMDDRRRFLNAFTSNQSAEGGSSRVGCDLGIVTIIGEEARAVQEWLFEYNDAARQRGPERRYVYRANVPVGNSSARVSATQALGQGQTSATNPDRSRLIGVGRA